MINNYIMPLHSLLFVLFVHINNEIKRFLLVISCLKCSKVQYCVLVNSLVTGLFSKLPQYSNELASW